MKYGKLIWVDKKLLIKEADRAEFPSKVRKTLSQGTHAQSASFFRKLNVADYFIIIPEF